MDEQTGRKRKRIASTFVPFLFLFRGIGRKWRVMRSLVWMVTGMAIGVLILVYVSAGEIYDYQDSFDGVHLPPVDAIVCLAGGRGRIATAGDIWYRYWELTQKPLGSAQRAAASDVFGSEPPILYISGMGHQSNWGVLAKQVRRGVLEVLRPETVVMETESTNTVENAEWFLKNAREKGWKKILLVTSRYHMRRAKHIFQRVTAVMPGEPIRIETVSVYQEPFEPGEWRSGLHGVRVTMQEYLKWIYYKVFWLQN